MKKILILYATYGGGHLSAAKSIQEYLNNNYTNIETEMIDCIEYINRTLNKVTTNAYKEIAKKAPILWGKVYSDSQKGLLGHVSSRTNKIMAIKLKNLIKEKQPDLIISTHPFGSQMVSYLKRKQKINCKLATILTDFAPHDQWLIGHEYTEFFFVSNNNMKKGLIQYGIDENKIHITGIPLSSRFFEDFNKDEIFEMLHFDKNKKVLLFFGGGEFGLGKSKTIEFLRSLISNSSDYQIIAISGKNEDMEQSFNNVVKDLNATDRVVVLKYTNKVPEFMNISDFVITKPGGLTVTESLACHLPIIIINPLPGQEEENAEFLEKNGVGIWIRNQANSGNILKELIHSKSKLENMRENTKLLSKPNSTKDICDILIDSL